MRKRVIALIALVVVLMAGIAAGVLFTQRQAREEQRRQTHEEQQRKAREAQLTSYYGVKLGSSKSEVGYILGYPSSVQGPFRPDPEHKGWQTSDELKVTKNGDLEGAPSDPPGGSALVKFDEWHYALPPDRVSVSFDETTKTVASIKCMQMDEQGTSKCRRILGVTVGSSEADVLKALGTPQKQNIDGIYKSMSYPNLGIELMLTQSHVYLITKKAPVGR